MNDDLTSWEQKERLEELEQEFRARGLPSPSEAVWDDGDSQSQIVNPAIAPYPPPYDPGPSAKPENDDG